MVIKILQTEISKFWCIRGCFLYSSPNFAIWYIYQHINNSRAYATVLRPSVAVCTEFIVAKRCVRSKNYY